MEDKHGTVMFMNDREINHMLKLSDPCYKNEYAKFNQYEATILEKHLKGNINIRQLAYYLGGITYKNAELKAKLYKFGRYELKNHKNYWELRK